MFIYNYLFQCLFKFPHSGSGQLKYLLADSGVKRLQCDENRIKKYFVKLNHESAKYFWFSYISGKMSRVE